MIHNGIEYGMMAAMAEGLLAAIAFFVVFVASDSMAARLGDVRADKTALLLALPRLSASLGATNIEQLWISDSYGFMVAGLVITMVPSA